MKPYFFEATRSAHTQITELFDFIFPAATGMWNLRLQVAEYLKHSPEATDRQLDIKFAQPANLVCTRFKKTCVNQSWDTQKELFARMLLINAIAIYEGWLDDVLGQLGAWRLEYKQALQFPSSVNAPGSGISAVIANLTAQESITLKNNFYRTLSSRHLYSLPCLNTMMRIYRYFKELRNCMMHRNSLATFSLVESYKSISGISDASLLGMREVPTMCSPIAGRPTQLDFLGVVGFADVILRVLVTLDAELSRSKHAERAFLERWALAHPEPVLLPNDFKQLRASLIHWADMAGFPEFENPAEMGDFLVGQGLAYRKLKRKKLLPKTQPWRFRWPANTITSALPVATRTGVLTTA